MSKDDLRIIDGSKEPKLIKENIVQQNWGVGLLGIPRAWQETQGEAVRVMLFDTGIDYTHPDFRDNWKYGFDVNKSPHTKDPMDHDGHGTHCAGIIGANGQITGVAPKCDLHMVKILGDKGEGDTNNLIDACKYAKQCNVDIVTMSLGTHQTPDEKVREAIRELIAYGVCIICATGNEGTQYAGDSVSWPAKYITDGIPEIIAVAAFDLNKVVPAWSSGGPETTIAAPGVEIYSTYLRHGYANLSGTSMATPFVAGTVALMIGHHRKDVSFRNGTLSPRDVKNLIISHAKQVNGIIGRNDKYGFGVIDESAIEAASLRNK